MAYRGVSHDGVDRSPGQNIPYEFELLRDRTYQAFFDQAVLDSPEEEPPPEWRGESQHRGEPSTHRVLSHDLLGRVVWRDGVDRTFGQNNSFDFDWSWISQLLDAPYCRWCWSPMPPYDSDHMFCEECRRWYDDAYCYWCWDPAGDWYPGWPDFHLALCRRCSRRYLQALGPPWYPNHEQRCHLRVRRLFEVQAQDTVCMLPGDVCDRVAGFLAQPWRP